MGDKLDVVKIAVRMRWMAKLKSTHHHGNLRPALISAGIDILETDGVGALSLRKIAAAAGVSHAAPAHHFKGKTALLVAIAAYGFRIFTDFMQKGREDAGPGPHDQLLGLCQGYLDFAAKHGALFELIFSTEIKSHADEDLQNASLRAFQLLEETCALFEPSRYAEKGNEIMVWSLVHGYATLRIHNKLLSQGDGSEMPFELILPRLNPRTQ
jgi:AcrR family transcriptional regulator